MLLLQYVNAIPKILKGKSAEVEAFRQGMKHGRNYIKKL